MVTGSGERRREIVDKDFNPKIIVKNNYNTM